jgi:GWxTD domain-containing protein
MISPRKISGLIFLISFLVSSCVPPATKTTNQKGLADIYNPGRGSLHPDFCILHVNDTNSVLYIRVYSTELLFNQANEEGKTLAKLKVFYELRELDPNVIGGVFVDSVSMRRVLNKDEVRSSFYSGLPIRAKIGKKYSLKVEVSDESKGSSTQSILIVDKISKFGDQNFKVVSPKTGYPSFTKNFAPGETFRILLNQLGIDSLFVEYYSLDRNLPRPSFSSASDIPLKSFPDTSFIYPYADSVQFELPIPGIYHFRMNPDVNEGLTLYNFGETFPRIKTPDDLLGPLVYLTSTAEFRDIRMESNRKLAIDNFWIKLNPDLASSRELIRVYYNRVYYANLFFSSFKEGWKTDRGMIYIIFGAPRTLEKSPDKEKWTYFSRKGGSNVVFVFNRNENHFTNLDYQLERNVNSSNFWREAIDSWRKGKVYSFDY